ncbi:hypothetical protein L249_2046 [Ophiocordyceps polyrhachis-furcata BCC 54312]|uniref:3-hydroxyisobutyryl-CoA hydrolase n=1 Tax=Ophiocordyceps polyrhachis-furcata BCC 54312 TaxID=1330021 RepID=A0A367LR01_9HYPO|nr:hypothetical protein L249_2046 [Ophiocordyceps polyrhachis-furcata BCC 54312]
MSFRTLAVRAGARVRASDLCGKAKMAGVRQLSAEAASMRELPGDDINDVVFESRFGLRTVLLNRPQKHNSLTGSMIRKIIPRLVQWEKSDMANVVVIKGAGDLAMCAGGDVLQLATQNQEDEDGWKKSAAYFALEYKLDHYIATYTKPLIAFMDGVTMGGGVGLSIHAPFRIATERTIFAMPETAIGFFPDVGASFFLPRMNGAIGTYLALTGDRLTGPNVFYAGIATHYLHSTSLPDLEARLAELRFRDSASYKQRLELINDTLEEFCTGLPYDQPVKLAGDVRRAVDRCFSRNTVGEIVAALREEIGSAQESRAEAASEETVTQEEAVQEREPPAPGSLGHKKKSSEKTATEAWAQQQLDTLLKRSPTSVHVALRQMRVAGSWDLAKVFNREYQMASKFMQHPDFTEGVTALLKRKEPARWKPESLQAIPEGLDVAAPFFKFEDEAPLRLFNDQTYSQYPHAFLGVPTEREVQDMVDSGKYTPEQLEKTLVASRKGRQGIAEVVREMIARKTGIDSSGKVVWETKAGGKLPVSACLILSSRSGNNMAATVIDSLRSPLLGGAVFLGGVAVYVVILRHGEWHMQVPRLIGGGMALTTAMACWLVWLAPSAPWLALKTTSWLVLMWLAGMSGSMFLYRAAMHPLRCFPGPFAARLTNLYAAAMEAKKRQAFRELRKLHEKYGDFVRVGPSLLSIRDPRAIRLIHDSRSHCTKDATYEVVTVPGPVSLHLTRDRKKHDRRRKAWDRALNTKAIRQYEHRVARCAAQLARLIDRTKGQPSDASGLFHQCSFDVMGEVGFGKSFDCLVRGVLPGAFVGEFMHMVGISRRMVLQTSALLAIPMVSSLTLGKLNKWASEQIVEWEQRASDLPDIMSYIIADHKSNGRRTKERQLNMQGDAVLLIIAGSETVSAALSCLFFELALNADARRTLQAELDQLHEAADEIDNTSLSQLKYLGACIDEALRLFPAVMSGITRITGSDGMKIGDVFIPADVTVQIPAYALSRDERIFVHGDDFIPERWTTRPELMVDGGAASFPFSTGPFSCVGRALALMELRYFTAEILWRFDVELAPGFTATDFEEGLVDNFTLLVTNLKLVFKPRRNA